MRRGVILLDKTASFNWWRDEQVYSALSNFRTKALEMGQDNRFEQRIIELEISLAHQQRLCEQLNEMVTEHTKQLSRFEKILPKLEEQIKELRAAMKPNSTDSAQEKPPHY